MEVLALVNASSFKCHGGACTWPVNDKSIVIVALLERDDGIDISGEELDNVQSWMRNKFADHSKSGKVSRAILSILMMTEFILAIGGNTSNDDIIGITPLPIPSSGQPKELTMDGDDGLYTVQFLVE